MTQLGTWIEDCPEHFPDIFKLQSPTQSCLFYVTLTLANALCWISPNLVRVSAATANEKLSVFHLVRPQDVAHMFHQCLLELVLEA